MKWICILAFASLTILSQLKFINGYNINNPAFTTLIQVFDLKARVLIQKDWEEILKLIFFLPDDILKDDKNDTFKWIDDFIQITNLSDIEEALERIPVTSTTKSILKIICQNLDYIDEGHERIYNIYFESFKQVNEEPICRHLSGFVGAVNKFLDKRLKISRVKKIIEELKKWQNHSDEIIKKITPKKNIVITKRKEYIKQMELVKRKFNRYEIQTQRTSANKENTDYDFDFLKMLQALVNELKEKNIALESSLEQIIQIVNEFNEQRIFWAESLLNIQFYHKKQRKHIFEGIFWKRSS
ncbi:uncharacterized protein LOC116352641 [Contarinia nasturtii]|uniref:uncharacterized protein LOC116352641 n=1 Tax=Contarinia nasturtii TaxID=265458 RepID=UPI0012D42ADD|nr:uncharacterized protein LOC116352641 [Contarinia nasturtii]